MMKKGFSLLEVIIAIGILVGGSLIVYGQTARILSRINQEKTKFVASYLAQEGIEGVRNMRDANWISGASSWVDGLGAGNYRVQYNSTSLLPYQDVALNLDSQGFYSYDTGTATPFKREITLSQPSADILKVVSKVTWPDNQNGIQAEDFLYNWH